MSATAPNKGWTIFGKKYHRAEYVSSLGWFAYGPCRAMVGNLDQVTHRHDGEPTGALVPEDLRPCKRCFPDGDA